MEEEEHQEPAPPAVDDVNAKRAAHVDGDEVPEVDDNSACKELEGEFDAVAEVFEVVYDA